jgi:predicted dinucleotide-binding enzyme
MVGNAIADKLASAGHEVMMGAREAGNPKARDWASKAGPKALTGTLAEAAKFGVLVFNCTKGEASLQALETAGSANLEGKVLVDVANPLDFSKGMPPSLTVCNTDSLGEQIQRKFPKTKVVKAFNTLSAALMGSPSALPGGHQLLICGNDGAAKQEVTTMVERDFGWKSGSVLDVGDITAARGTEAYLLLWIRLYGRFGTPLFNFQFLKGA